MLPIRVWRLGLGVDALALWVFGSARAQGNPSSTHTHRSQSQPLAQTIHWIAIAAFVLDNPP
jgi:hypothetical protein